MAQRKKPPRANKKPSAARMAALDGLATAVFVFAAAAISHLAKPAAPLLGLSVPGAGLALMLVLLIAMGPACPHAAATAPGSNLAAMAVGLRPDVSILEGAACEFVLGAVLAFVVLWAGQLRSSLLKLWIPLAATVLAVKAGEGLSGPSLNPVFTFAFHLVYPTQDIWEHVVVYWAAPLAAGLFGGWAFRGWQQWAAERSAAAQPRSKQRRAKAE